MSQIIANPEELRRFAHALNKFNEGLTESLNALNTQLNNLSATWRDQENMKFTEEFASNMKLCARFVESNNEYIPFLMRKAQRIDEYLSQR